MFSRSRIVLWMVLLLSFIIVPAVSAGGWAVVTVDELPVSAVAGEPLTIGFMVRQHGRTPTPGLSPTITFTLLLKEDQFTVTAKEDDITGHYSASVTLPKEGDWYWTVDAFSFPQPMPIITVVAPAIVEISQPVGTGTLPYTLIVRVVALGMGLLSLFFTLRTKSRIAIAVTALCLMLGLASFIPGSTVPKVEAQAEPTSQPEEVFISQVEYGRRLFIAKGCVTCHFNNRALAKDSIHIDMGAPDLSKFSANPEALFLRLKDPASVKSDTMMPNLGLSEVEIEALIAFINSK